MVARRYQVRWRRRETHDTVTLGLLPVGEPIPAWAPGQFTVLHALGTGEVPISVSGGRDASGDVLVHTVRAAGAATRMLCALTPGETVWVRGPYGRGWADPPPAADLVLVAGGIGLAPLRPVVLATLSQAQRTGRVVVLVGARTPADLPFTRELSAWADWFGVHVAVTVDRAPPSWTGPVGPVTDLVARARFDPDGALAMVCGPEPMMRSSAVALRERGVPAERTWLWLERAMRRGVGLGGHRQHGRPLVCRDGPVAGVAEADALLAVGEL